MTDWSSNSDQAQFPAAKPTPRLLWIGLALSLLGLVIEIVGPVLGMWTSFQRIETMPAPTPADVALGPRTSIVSLIAGAICLGIGALLTVIAILRMQREKQLDL